MNPRRSGAITVAQRSSGRIGQGLIVVNWSAINRRSTVGRLLRGPLNAIPKSTVVPILSGPNRGFKWCVGSADHGCWLGSYELEKQRAIWRLRREGATALDVGANVGYYTLLLSRAVGPSGRVIAIEPDPRNADRIRFHARVNRVSHIHVVEGVAAARSGAATFSAGPTPTTGRIALDGVGEEVRAYTLDDIVFGDDAHVPSIVKMDIEGGESAALVGASLLLAARQTTWFVALHSDEQAEFCIATFRRHGYRVCFPDGAEIPRRCSAEISEIVAIA